MREPRLVPQPRRPPAATAPQVQVPRGGPDSTPADPEQVATIDAELDLFLPSGAARQLRNVSSAPLQRPEPKLFEELRNGEDTLRTVPMSSAWCRCSGNVPKNSSEMTPSMPPAPRQPVPPAAHGLAAANALAPWSCIDLNLLAVAVVASEYTGLVDSLIAGMLACESGQAKVAPFGEVLEGTWILLVGVVLSWAAQAVATYNLRRNARAPHVV